MEAYKEFTAKMHTTYQPFAAVEEQFFYIVADTFWRMNLGAREFNLFSLELHEHRYDLNVKHEEAHVALPTACTPAWPNLNNSRKPAAKRTNTKCASPPASVSSQSPKWKPGFPPTMASLFDP